MSAAFVIERDVGVWASSPTIRVHAPVVHCDDDLGIAGSSRTIDVAQLEDGDIVREDGAALRFVRDIGDPLTRVKQTGSWLAIDVESLWRGLRCRALRYTERGLQQATLVITRPDDPRVFPSCEGVRLSLFARRAGDALEPAMAVQLARRAWSFQAHDAVITWDGDVLDLPSMQPVSQDEVTRVNGLLTMLFDSERVAALDASGDDRALLRDALSYDVFDALILARDVERALHRVQARAVSRDELADVVRALFPEAWRIERELREQFATLDADALRWLRRV